MNTKIYPFLFSLPMSAPSFQSPFIKSYVVIYSIINSGRARARLGQTLPRLVLTGLVQRQIFVIPKILAKKFSSQA